MNNSYVYFLAFIAILKIFINSLVANKIDSTISLINEQMVSSCVSELSKYDMVTYDSSYYINLDKDVLKAIVNNTMSENLPFVTYKAKYYFYNNRTANNTPVANKNNSVQIKITITYDKKNYERILRYEPFKV